MTIGWLDARLPPWRPAGADWLRIVWRGTQLATVVFGGFAVFLLIRLVEFPFAEPARPMSSRITQGVCRIALTILHIRPVRHGKPLLLPGALVANHAGWVDVFVLNAAHRVTFVAKSDVAHWPGIGLLARATGTLFITRKGTAAKRQQEELEARLRVGHRLMFFPEGTSTDGLRILPFKSTLFAAFFAPGLREGMNVQPVTVVYHAPPRTDPRHYGWWGDMTFAGHLLRLLATSGWGRVDVTFHPSLAVADFADRKALAQRCEAAVRSAHPGV